MVYLVTFDLDKKGAGYDRANSTLNGALDRLTTIKDPGLDSVRFVSTNWTANELYNYLAPYIDKNDRLVVSKINLGEHQGWLNTNIWTWINLHLQ